MREVSVTNIPDKLLEDFDEAIKDRWPKRNEAIRALMQDFVDKQKETQQ